MRAAPRRFPLLVLTTLLVGGLVGGLLGGRVRADSERPEDKLWTFGRVLSLVEDQYVGDANPKDLVENAIDGLLGSLDPHSNYLNAESFGEMRDEQRGRFYGLGIQITKRGPDKPLTIITPIDGTPADRAGLISGDIISEIEGEPTIDLTVREAVRLLKGDKGTQVTITIQRPGLNDPFQVTIERDEIPIQSVRVSYMVEPTTGVVRISNFNTTTADELDEAVQNLRDQGMQRLVLDLRGNPGGLLDQAVQVSERFIAPNQMVVYTRGRIPGSNQDFFARNGTIRYDLPVIVLVDHSSASASEIVSGAIQDHDRGLVVGDSTFGKGLVQRVIPLQNGGALAVTTAKYYTPSGRLIQRDYSDLEDYYLNRDGEEDVDSPPDTTVPSKDDREVFYTRAGREVYGGGGITPDYVVKSDAAPEILSRLRRENLIFDFAVTYNNAHPQLNRGFRMGPADLGELERYLTSRDFEFEAEELRADWTSVREQVRARIARIKWDQVEESQVLAEIDNQLREALKLFDEAARLHANSSEALRAQLEISEP